jgi:ATP-dependent RNA helicase UAP56/SUB2
MPQDTEDLIDYEDEHDVPTTGATATNGATAATDADGADGRNFSGIHSTGFRYVLLLFTSIMTLISIAEISC